MKKKYGRDFPSHCVRRHFKQETMEFTFVGHASKSFGIRRSGYAPLDAASSLAKSCHRAQRCSLKRRMNNIQEQMMGIPNALTELLVAEDNIQQ